METPPPSPLSAHPNVQLSAVATVIADIILHICKAHGIDIDTDTAIALPGAVAVLFAYIPDAIAGWRQQKAAGPAKADGAPAP